MNGTLCYTTTAPDGAVFFMDGQTVEPSDAARSRIYDAWRRYGRAVALPCTPLRWLALTHRIAQTTLFPLTPSTPR